MRWKKGFMAVINCTTWYWSIWTQNRWWSIRPLFTVGFCGCVFSVRTKGNRVTIQDALLTYRPWHTENDTLPLPFSGQYFQPHHFLSSPFWACISVTTASLSCSPNSPWRTTDSFSHQLSCQLSGAQVLSLSGACWSLTCTCSEIPLYFCFRSFNFDSTFFLFLLLLLSNYTFLLLLKIFLQIQLLILQMILCQLLLIHSLINLKFLAQPKILIQIQHLQLSGICRSPIGNYFSKDNP